MENAIARAADVDLDSLQRMAHMMVASGYFDASKDVKQAIAQMAVKILAGREMGYGPFASIQGIHVVSGKPTLAANLMAAAVKAHPRYDYRVREMTTEKVVLEFFEDGDSLGKSDYTFAEAQAAGLTGKDVWRKYPKNMLFARALSNGVRWFCPDVFAGSAVYVPEELGAEVDGDGNMIDVVEHRNGSDKLPESLNEVPKIDPDGGESPKNDEPQPVDYGAIVDSLTGDCRKLADWALNLHANSDGPASAAQYKYLAGAIDKHTNGQHGHVLGVFCRRDVSQDKPCGYKLASALLDVILPKVAVKGDDGKSLKDDNGKVVYEDNLKFRQDVVDCLVAIAKTAQPA